MALYDIEFREIVNTLKSTGSVHISDEFAFFFMQSNPAAMAITAQSSKFMVSDLATVIEHARETIVAVFGLAVALAREEIGF